MSSPLQTMTDSTGTLIQWVTRMTSGCLVRTLGMSCIGVGGSEHGGGPPHSKKRPEGRRRHFPILSLSILSPPILSPAILSLSPAILSPAILSPAILSPAILSAVVILSLAIPS